MTVSARNPQGRIPRRGFLAGIGLVALALAGCQTRGPAPVRPTGPPPPVQGNNGEVRNRVAVIVPLTGDDGAVGQAIANAANLALLDSGDKSLRLTIYNSAGPGGAAAATSKAIGDGSRLILGPLLADEVRAAAPVAREAGVPVIAFSNDEGVAGNGVYILGFTPNQSIGRVVDLARKRGLTRFAALVPQGLYGQRAAQAMLGAVQDSGGRMVALQTFSRTGAGVRASAASLNAKGTVDAVLIGDSGRIAAVAAPVLRSGQQLLGTELWTSDRGLGTTPALRGAWYAAVPDTRFNQLAVRYRTRYGNSPVRIASLGYDAVLLAVRSGRDWPIAERFPARALADRDGFAGVDGIFRFDRRGIAQRALEVRRVTATGTTILSPAETKFSE
ncbi:penicillin-binding protein activator [Sphingomonas sp.]|uniref:penicillin-binding protein activator n=1 Tax=Sphingomonas sp. TaxID=28214 RepID=UPI00286BF654|nr:penicillin-binding protein activator [Sphingomonas sp.]